MSNLRILNGDLITPERVEKSDLFIKDGLIDFVPIYGEGEIAHTIDAENCYVSPGLFDLQVNGSPECDLWGNPNIEQFAQLCISMLKTGVTTFLPTLITADLGHLHENIRFLESLGVGMVASANLNEAIKKILGTKLNMALPNSTSLINLPGIHLEGPYLSPQRVGAHPPQHIRPINISKFIELMHPSIKLVTFAPELDNADQVTTYLLNHSITPSLGHSNATFEQANHAFKAGIHLVTHIFNALPPIQQRQPGAVVAALLDENVYCCVICDGLHVDPEIIRLLVKIKGPDRVILVTDTAHIGTTGGSLIGSSLKLSEAITNIVNWNIVTFPQAVQMATINPARIMNLDKNIGQIVKGRRADLVIWNKDTYKIKHVIANGIRIV
jgi:N-acetylglucosamine-6-phosphate deacetylase